MLDNQLTIFNEWGGVEFSVFTDTCSNDDPRAQRALEDYKTARQRNGLADLELHFHRQRVILNPFRLEQLIV